MWRHMDSNYRWHKGSTQTEVEHGKILHIHLLDTVLKVQ